MIGLFCRIQSLLYGSFAKESYDFKESTNRSHPIVKNTSRISVLQVHLNKNDTQKQVKSNTTALGPDPMKLDMPTKDEYGDFVLQVKERERERVRGCALASV